MLQDFPVAVSLPSMEWPVALGLDGATESEPEPERYVVICRDIPTAVFFYGFPNSLPATPCFEGAKAADQWRELQQLRDWMMVLLSRVAVDPELSSEQVYRLDEHALDGVVGYLHAVGWITDEDLATHAAGEGSMAVAARRYQQSLGALAEERLRIPAAAAARYGDRHRPFNAPTAPNIRGIVAEVARKAHCRPSTIWQTPISEFLFDFRLLITDELKSGRVTGITPEDAAIGFERYE